MKSEEKNRKKESNNYRKHIKKYFPDKENDLFPEYEIPKIKSLRVDSLEEFNPNQDYGPWEMVVEGRFDMAIGNGNYRIHLKKLDPYVLGELLNQYLRILDITPKSIDLPFRKRDEGFYEIKDLGLEVILNKETNHCRGYTEKLVTTPEEIFFDKFMDYVNQIISDPNLLQAPLEPFEGPLSLPDNYGDENKD